MQKKHDSNKREAILPSPSEGKSIALARRISRYSNPFYIAPLLYLIVALASAPNVIQGLLWWGIIGLGVTVTPLLFIRRGVRRGHYSDHHVSKREERLIPLLISVGCMGIVMAVLVLINASYDLMGTMTAMIIDFIIALLITHWASWKISMHLIGITGAISTLALLMNPFFWLLSPFIILLGWSRWMVNAHTPPQVCAGALLGSGVTAVVFAFFGLL